MEGAAFAYACTLFAVPYAQVRAVSNLVERRNRDAWRMDLAVRNLNAIAVHVLERACALTLGFSPCPNDCFMFDALVHHRIDLEGLEFEVTMADVEALNRRAFAQTIDVTKLSYHAFAHRVADYALLDAGSALGRGCGPLLISQRPDRARRSVCRWAADRDSRRLHHGELSAVAGLSRGSRQDTKWSSPRSRPRCSTAAVDAGVIIHENRFTYQDKGLRKVIDLGEFWEQSTGTPIPLGGIVARRSLPAEVQQAMERVMRRSVEHAFAHPADSRDFVRAHAQEMSEDVMRQHIDLYVNDYSVTLGEHGRRAVNTLIDRAIAAGLIHPPVVSLFVPAKHEVHEGHEGHEGHEDI